MTITRQRMMFFLSILMMTLMFSGYVLTTGLEIIASEGAKAVIRAVVFLLSIIIIFIGQSLRWNIVISSYLALSLLILNQNLIALNLLFLLFMVASLNRLPERQVAIVFLIASIVTVMLHIMLVSLGMVSTVSTDVGERTRSALGFANANQFALVYLTLICSNFFVHLQFRTRGSLLMLGGALILSLHMMQIADSRTSIFSVLLLITLVCFSIISSKNRMATKIFVCSMASIPMWACIITFYLISNTDPLLDIALSFRPSLFAEFMSTVSWQNLILGWNPVNDGNVDNAYLMLLSAVGLPVFILIILLLMIRLAGINPYLLPIAAVVLIASIFESFLVRPEIPLSVLFFSLIFRKVPARVKVRPRVAYA